MIIRDNNSTRESSAIARINYDLFGDDDIELDKLSVTRNQVSLSPSLQKKLIRSTLLYKLPSIWLENSGLGIKVAVIDTGIDTDHRAFGMSRDQFASGVDFKSPVIERAASVIDDNIILVIEDGRLVAGRKKEDLDLIHDKNGHGTHCAGIIGARPLRKMGADFVPHEPIRRTERKEDGRVGALWEPSEGFFSGSRPQAKFEDLDVPFSGVAPRCKLLIYKVTKDATREARLDDIALAMNTAVDDGAHIISLSMEAEEGTYQLYKAVHRTLSFGRKLVVAAGNRGTLLTQGIGFPAYYGGVITVASHGRFGGQSAFSSLSGEVDIGAPGEDIWSAWTGRRYRMLSGTSMAAPFVAGISALMLSDQNEPNSPLIRNNQELRQQLLELATHPGFYDPTQLGYGAIIAGSYAGRETEIV